MHPTDPPRLDLEPLILRMCSGTATSPQDLATLARLAGGRKVWQPHHPALDRVWAMAYKREHLADAMRAATHWRIQAIAAMHDDPASRLCGHLAEPSRCTLCPRLVLPR